MPLSVKRNPQIESDIIVGVIDTGIKLRRGMKKVLQIYYTMIMILMSITSLHNN